MSDTSSIEHSLKTWPEYFEAVANGTKTFEVRNDDRGFKVGDTLVLMEFDPKTDRYTEREIKREVTYVLRGVEDFGVKYGYVILGLNSPVSSNDSIEQLGLAIRSNALVLLKEVRKACSLVHDGKLKLSIDDLMRFDRGMEVLEEILMDIAPIKAHIEGLEKELELKRSSFTTSDLNKLGIHLTFPPTQEGMFDSGFDCRVVDIGHSDFGLVIESAELESHCKTVATERDALRAQVAALVEAVNDHERAETHYLIVVQDIFDNANISKELRSKLTPVTLALSKAEEVLLDALASTPAVGRYVELGKDHHGVALYKGDFALPFKEGSVFIIYHILDTAMCKPGYIRAYATRGEIEFPAEPIKADELVLMMRGESADALKAAEEGELGHDEQELLDKLGVTRDGVAKYLNKAAEQEEVEL